MNVGLSVLLYRNKFGSSMALIYLQCQIRHRMKYVRVYIDPYVCVIYRTGNVLEIEFHPSWNILESHFFIAVRTLLCTIINNVKYMKQNSFYAASSSTWQATNLIQPLCVS